MTAQGTGAKSFKCRPGPQKSQDPNLIEHPWDVPACLRVAPKSQGNRRAVCVQSGAEDYHRAAEGEEEAKREDNFSARQLFHPNAVRRQPSEKTRVGESARIWVESR